MSRLLLLITATCAPFALSGCLIGTAVEVAAETVEAGVEITGAAAGAVVDVVTDDDDDDKKDEDDKD